MNLENVKYDAFISYRHCELDKFVAVNLHKQLEAFKIPKSLIKAGKTNGKTKIERVFRDQDELPLTNNLADPITRALQGSEFLIVICSPRLKESKWCLTEIETFISMHGRDHILAVLIEGEPVDSFPEILRFEERVITDEYGYTRLEKFEVEPLAADVRGQNKSEILKKIKSELLRLVAPMLNCNYDDLKMRHKEARQKKILRISFAISLVCLIFTAISTTMALTIRKQANTIEEQYQTVLKNQAISHASISQTLLNQEDRMAAMAVARMVLPDSLNNPKDKPYTAAAEFALSDSLAIYNNGENNFPIRTLEQNSPISFMKVAPDETSITTVDKNSIITIYDVASASIIDSFTTNSKHISSVDDETDIDYLDSNKLAYIAADGFYIYDIPTKKETFYSLDNTGHYLYTSPDGKYIAICTAFEFIIFDNNGNRVYSKTFPSSYTVEMAISINTEKSLCAFTYTGDSENGVLCVINYITGAEIYSAELDISCFNNCVFYEEQLIVTGQKYNYLSDKPWDYTADIHMFSFPLDNNKSNWEFVKKDASFDGLTGTKQWKNQTIVLTGNDEITFINGKNGSLIHSTSLGSSVVDVTPLITEGSVFASTKLGEKIYVNSDTSQDNIVIESFDTDNGEFSDFYYSTEFTAAHHVNSTTINIYRKITSDKAQTVATFDDYILDTIYSTKQDTFAASGYNDQIFLTNSATEDIITITPDNYLNDMFFTGDNDEQFVLLDSDALTYYDTNNGNLLKEVSLSDAFIKLGTFPSTYLGSTKDHETLVYTALRDKYIYLYSIKEDTAISIPLPKNIPATSTHIGINETGDKYALAYIEDNTLSIFDKNSELLVETEINAALVNNIIISDTANCVIVSYLDKSVSFYRLSDLSAIKTYTNIKSDIEKLDIISLSDSDSTPPAYVLYGESECYLLDQNMEQLARLQRYIAYNPEESLFYLANSDYILSVPYYNYDMLIKEADKQLENYELSDYRKNQLGI